ncbi:hypothetical protein JYU20_00505 [Bacteroidales bacterium AH-315-I05]|nr:hypothetical protein [Bacteroidales bacterium AH-315-I05]
MNRRIAIVILIAAIILLLIFAASRVRAMQRKPMFIPDKKIPAKEPSFPLKKGDFNSQRVLQLQQMLNATCIISPLLLKPLGEDGDFGPLTEERADICLGEMKGHIPGKVTYAEFQYLKKQFEA